MTKRSSEWPLEKKLLPAEYQHGGSILGSVILCGTSRRISQLWDDAHTLNLENCLLYLLSTISQFCDFVRCIVFDFIFYCVTAHTLYWSAKRKSCISTQNKWKPPSRMTKTNPKKMLYRKREISATPIQLHFKELYGERYPLTLAPNPETKAVSYAGKTIRRCSIFFFKVALSSAEVSFVLLCCFVRNGGRGPGEGEKTAARGGMPRRGKREERLFPSTHRSPRALPLFKNFPQGASAEERERNHK